MSVAIETGSSSSRLSELQEHRFRVLISTQDPRVVRAVREGLSAESFEILSLPAHGSLIESAIDQSPDLFILDLDRSGDSAAEAVRVLKKVRPALRIVALSAESCSRDAAVVSEGVFYYTVKPVGPDLLEVVRAAARPRRRPGGEDR